MKSFGENTKILKGFSKGFRTAQSKPLYLLLVNSVLWLKLKVLLQLIALNPLEEVLIFFVSIRGLPSKNNLYLGLNFLQ